MSITQLALDLTAIPKIYQMRPDFNHINVQAEMKKKKSAEREKLEKEREGGDMDDEDGKSFISHILSFISSFYFFILIFLLVTN